MARSCKLMVSPGKNGAQGWTTSRLSFQSAVGWHTEHDPDPSAIGAESCSWKESGQIRRTATLTETSGQKSRVRQDPTGTGASAAGILLQGDWKYTLEPAVSWMIMTALAPVRFVLANPRSSETVKSTPKPWRAHDCL